MYSNKIGYNEITYDTAYISLDAVWLRSETMSEKEMRQFKMTYVAAGAICLCFLACSLFFVFHMMRQNEAENMQYLYDMAYQNSITMKKQATGDFQTLEGIAICFSEADIREEEQLRAILRKINDNNAFIRMGIADTDGNLDLLDIDGRFHEDLDVSERDFFKEAMTGRDSISNAFLDSLNELENDSYINYYGVPLRKDGIVSGVLCAVSSSDVLREIIDAPILNGRGFSCVIDSTGAMVIRSMYQNESGGNATSLAEIGTIEKGELDRILQTMKNGENGDFTYAADGEEQVSVFVPTGIKDWYVFSMVSKSALKQRYSQTALGTTLIIAAACLIFLYLLRRQSRLMEDSQQALMRLAYFDPLTGCRNLPRFIIDAPEVIGRDESVHYAIWYCDLKRFKYFNDVFGYEAGDRVLKYLAEIFGSSSSDALFCRISADNFAGLLTYHRKDELVQWFEGVQDCLSSEEAAAANRIHAELSIGFYCVDESEEKLTVKEMVNRANMAQKSAKNSGDCRFAFFNNKTREKILRDAEMEAGAKRALEAGEFVLYLQPKVNIQNANRLAGAEVLVRWNSREKGLIPPIEFISLFERNGFIVPLDRYIFERTCEWFAAYLKEGRPSINLAVNVSRIGMLQEDFVSYYSSVKERYQIPDYRLELEFTESMIVDDEMFTTTVERLRKKGFVCSMDDFGSGYSSLNLLKNLPIDVLKLDILFFKEGTDLIRERTVVSNVITMAKELKIETIAEGVETEEQVEFLRSAGCDIVQGYVFAKPMPLAQFDDMLRDIERKDFTV